MYLIIVNKYLYKGKEMPPSFLKETALYQEKKKALKYLHFKEIQNQFPSFLKHTTFK